MQESIVAELQTPSSVSKTDFEKDLKLPHFEMLVVSDVISTKNIEYGIYSLFFFVNFVPCI
jgi:hypothetical protein